MELLVFFALFRVLSGEPGFVLRIQKRRFILDILFLTHVLWSTARNPKCKMID